MGVHVTVHSEQREDLSSCESLPKVSVILLNYNGARFSALWESLFVEEYPNKEILFVDNGSSDDSLARFQEVRAAHPNIESRVICVGSNEGFGVGNNLGYAQSTGEVISLVNPDVKVTPHWIAPVVEFFVSHPDVAVIGSKLMSLEQPETSDLSWNCIDSFGFPHVRELSHTEAQEVFFVEGSSIFVRREVIEKLGALFYPDYFLLWEDVDLCWRVRLLGFRCMIEPRSLAYHVRGGTASGRWMKRGEVNMASGTRNRLVSLYTNYGTTRLILFLPPAFFLTLTEGLLLWGTGQRREARGVFRGMYRAIKDSSGLGGRRSHVQSLRKVKDIEVIRLVLDPISGLCELWQRWVLARNEGTR
jgi:GT2 family glycosyltransferase